MEWQFALLLIFGGLIVLMVTGLPVAFCFLVMNMVGAIIWWGVNEGFGQLVQSMFSSVNSFSLLCVPLFILMGDVMFHSGIAPLMIDTMDEWLGRLPGRLGLLAVAAGTLVATMTGTTVGSTALLGSVLVPEMEKRGYKKTMSLGPILGSGGLALMIPPSFTAVIFGAIGQVPIGPILIAIIVPGVLMAALYAIYIILRCWVQPSLAPRYEVSPTPLAKKIVDTVRYVLPLGLVIFLVTGLIFLGVATPSEAAGTGVLGTVLLAVLYRKLNWKVMRKSFLATIRITIMTLIIIAGAQAYSQILSTSGASRGMIELLMSAPLGPIIIIIVMMVIGLILGCFMGSVAIMLITLPIFMPVVYALDFNPVWFAVIMCLDLEMGTLTPPFGLGLFVMKGIAPPDTTMGDIIVAALPFIYLNVVALVLIIAFPAIALWLPGLMR